MNYFEIFLPRQERVKQIQNDQYNDDRVISFKQQRIRSRLHIPKICIKLSCIIILLFTYIYRTENNNRNTQQQKNHSIEQILVLVPHQIRFKFLCL